MDYANNMCCLQMLIPFSLTTLRPETLWHWLVFSKRFHYWVLYLPGPPIPMTGRPRGRSAADRLLGLRVRIPPGAWMFVRFECCQVEVFTSGRSLVHWVLPTEVCYCVWSRNLKNEAALARGGLLRQRRKSLVSFFLSSISASVTPLECKTLFQCVAAGGYMSVCFSVN
jgi:hypothetical protein